MADFQFRPDTWDRIIFDCVVTGNEYMLPPRMDGWVIDCGSHIGCFAHASIVRGVQKVIGFEPYIENHKLACLNLAPYPQAEIRWGALNPYPSEFHTLYFKESVGPQNTGGGTVGSEDGAPVPAFSLDRVLSELPGKGTLKLDCEGGEYGILETCRTLGEKVHTIVGECHFHEDGATYFKGILFKNYLASRGYKVVLKPRGREGLFLACQGDLWPSWVDASPARKKTPLPCETDPILRFYSQLDWPDPVTFGLFCPGFGDIWRSVQYACWVQATRKCKVSLYTNWHGIPNVDYSETPLSNKEALIREILPVLDTSGQVELVHEAPAENYFSLCGVYPFYVPNVPTKLRWQGAPGKRFNRIAYQLDGASWASKKNPPQEEIPALLNFAPGFEFVRLGKHLSVQACLEAAAHSDLFIGVDSGMMQLCYAAGVPAFLIRYAQDTDVLDVWHGRRSAIQCKNTFDLLFKARAYLGLE